MVVSANAGLELCGLERAAKRLRLSHLAEGRQGSASTRSVGLQGRRLDGVQSVENAAAASSGVGVDYGPAQAGCGASGDAAGLTARVPRGWASCAEPYPGAAPVWRPEAPEAVAQSTA